MNESLNLDSGRKNLWENFTSWQSLSERSLMSAVKGDEVTLCAKGTAKAKRLNNFLFACLCLLLSSFLLFNFKHTNQLEAQVSISCCLILLFVVLISSSATLLVDLQWHLWVLGAQFPLSGWTGWGWFPLTEFLPSEIFQVTSSSRLPLFYGGNFASDSNNSKPKSSRRAQNNESKCIHRGTEWRRSSTYHLSLSQTPISNDQWIHKSPARFSSKWALWFSTDQDPLWIVCWDLGLRFCASWSGLLPQLCALEKGTCSPRMDTWEANWEISISGLMGLSTAFLP